jgi:hypothetical protein
LDTLKKSLIFLAKKGGSAYYKYKQLIIYFEQELHLRPIQPGEDAPSIRMISDDFLKVTLATNKLARFMSAK